MARPATIGKYVVVAELGSGGQGVVYRAVHPALGQEVVVVNFQKGVAEVDTWEHFINQEEEGEPISKTAADDLEALRALIEGAERDDEEYVLRPDQPRQP